MIFLDKILNGLSLSNQVLDASRIQFINSHADSEDVFAVTELASHSIAAAGLALSNYIGCSDADIQVDQHLSYLWFKSSARPQGWSLPNVWDDLAGDYRASDGWVRLHTNAPHHRKAVCDLLGNLDRTQMIRKVETWSATELENAVVQRGGAAAEMMDMQTWAQHPQGQAVVQEPLISWDVFEGRVFNRSLFHDRSKNVRSLVGLRVLDLTRIIAGPVATRFLSSFGANVLRINPPLWDEGANIVDMNHGKKCATLDLTKIDDVKVLHQLISQADVMVHGLRTDALERLGLGDKERRHLNPTLIDVALNAYGWMGPWKNRRGFDSLVQMSSGIAEAGMRGIGGLSHKHQVSPRFNSLTNSLLTPRPMSVQALDHATGYLMAASVLTGLSHLKQTGNPSSARLSLARTAELLKLTKRRSFGDPALGAQNSDYGPHIEATDWGSVLRLKPVLDIKGVLQSKQSPATYLHSHRAMF
jgi:crotonobetainyl-CoA:carnitine CoA-transferase CaiB-like acyl-CoA transferase